MSIRSRNMLRKSPFLSQLVHPGRSFSPFSPFFLVRHPIGHQSLEVNARPTPLLERSSIRARYASRNSVIHQWKRYRSALDRIATCPDFAICFVAAVPRHNMEIILLKRISSEQFGIGSWDGRSNAAWVLGEGRVLRICRSMNLCRSPASK
jgi:hypothetical protein